MKFGIREIIFICLLLAILAASWWIVFRPMNARNKQMLAEIKTRQEKLRALNQATATIGDLKAEIAALDEAILFFHSKLPGEQEIDKVLREVWRLALANELNTKSIRTLKLRDDKMVTDPAGPYAEQPISMQLEGPFDGFYGFLLALEAQPRIMRIQEMKITKLTKAAEGYMRAECTMSVFFERSGEE